MAGETRVLVADEDASVREVVRLGCVGEGWQCDTAKNGVLALKMLRRHDYSLVLLDTDLPEVDGLVVCRQLRKTKACPVIFLSKRAREEDRLAGFRAGGNDYLIKPFFPRELMARAHNLIEMSGVRTRQTQTIVAGGIRIEPGSRTAYLNNQRIALAPREYELLAFFAQNPGQAFSRDQLLDLVWGLEFEGGDRTVDTHIKSLRGKIRPFQSCIETVWGYGYKFSP